MVEKLDSITFAFETDSVCDFASSISDLDSCFSFSSLLVNI
jgi:hypothetical protein